MTIERSLSRLLAAEFVGTFALVFAGCGAIMVDAQTGALAAAAILRGSLGNVADVGAMLPSGSQGKPRQVTVRRGRPNGDRLRRLRAGQTPISAETRPEVAASWSAR